MLFTELGSDGWKKDEELGDNEHGIDHKTEEGIK
jgi:hypothetical protein